MFDWSARTWVIIWLVGFILALIIVIYWGDFKDEDGATVINVTNVTIVLSISAIANWAIVALFLCACGMWTIVKIGEFLSKLGNITIYRSEPPKKKGKSKKTA